MRNVIVSTYKNLRDSDTITMAYRVVDKMENNPFFPDAPSALADAKKLLPDLQSSVSDAKGRDVEAIALKNTKKAELIALLTVLADYVTMSSKGDRVRLLSSGFPISGASSTQIDQVIPELDVKLGAPGEATTIIKRLRGARAYMHQFTNEPPTSETVWHSEGSKDAHYTFSGLSSMVKCWFRVVAITGTGDRITSPVVVRVIQ